ncbi:hypothetical protein [Streptomyces jumonjinensis]|uniref:hypothetical protein n=1 Tax=Streptomyces jumonjinensis TaxID=1945 RepID=UPI0037B5A3CA
MSRVVRMLAVTGAAAVAVLGTGPSAAAADTPETATAVVEAAVRQAAGAPVTLPSGRTIRIGGMESAAYRADAGHRSTVVRLAADPVPDGGGVSGMNLNQQPLEVRQQPGYGTQQVRTQAGGGAIGVNVAIGLALLVIVIVGTKKGHVRWPWTAACVALGVYLAPTVVGPLIQGLGGSVGQSLGNVWGGL